MKTNVLSFDSQTTQTIELPSEVAAMLKNEARRSRKSVAEFLMQWLEDQADGREAAKRLKLIKQGKTKASPAAEVYAKLGI
jgi:hypothetical protein